MPGIYTRDQFAQQLAQAIENANTRRQASLDREAARTESNAKALSNFGEALGRWYETSGDLESKLAALQKEKEEAIAAQKYNEQVKQRLAMDEYLKSARPAAEMKDYVPISKYGDAMANYRPTEPNYSARPDYDYIMNRRGLY